MAPLGFQLLWASRPSKVLSIKPIGVTDNDGVGTIEMKVGFGTDQQRDVPYMFFIMLRTVEPFTKQIITSFR